MSFWGELKRRNVFKIGVAYAVVAWLIVQVATAVLPNFDAPRWIVQTIILLLMLGFPVALLLAWAYEMTPEGVKRSGQVPQIEGAAHLTDGKFNDIVAGLRVKTSAEVGAPMAKDSEVPVQQEVRFCTSSDGVGIAYSVVGEGPPLVKTANWLNHLEYDWESPIWRHLLREFSSRHSLIRYDARGNGLSDWDVDDISFDGFVRDLEAVVDAVGLERFPLFGVSQGCAVSIAYAVRHPERVTKLILYGGFARGRRKRGSKNDNEESSAMMTLMRQGWGKENPAFRQMFTSLFIPGATGEQMTWFNELQRITTSSENAVKLRRAVDEIDVTGILDQVKTPTLALHCRGDAVQPFEEGRRMAAMIPKARFVTLEGANHLMLESDPAWPRFKEEVRAFLAEA